MFEGFGRSDKPVADQVYTFDFHHEAPRAPIDALDFRNITLVCEDRRRLLGQTLRMDRADRFNHLIIMNTTLATGEYPLGSGFEMERAFNRSQPDADIAALMERATPSPTAAKAAAYSAPFPDKQYKAGIRRFPDLVPASPNDPEAATSRRAARWWTEEWSGSSLMAAGVQDPVLTPAMMEGLCAIIRGCPPPMIIEDAGHFVQEKGEAVARSALEAFVAG